MSLIYNRVYFSQWNNKYNPNIRRQFELQGARALLLFDGTNIYTAKKQINIVKNSKWRSKNVNDFVIN